MPHKKVRTFTATDQEAGMLEAIARYHGFSKSATITSLIKKEFWRVFPAGNRAIRPDRGARVVEPQGERRARGHEE
ncbi:MAG TPA: hypothetical protein VFT43_03520 [Candidatus Polarisedimenticolia bacterium]|nr:hypothetical protein [Candidatus Polarisedimenticolia bacterium]